ncbi:MAG: UvrD-helicase domain-containing protein [Bdellovibrionales bacterium]|nr:UvrD-helicase domain-containing protein [Bdellovibrionales bacterium]
MTLRREIVEAGAGCGKTYRLVSRYIEGLGFDAETGAPLPKTPQRHPRDIIALTFTEDAGAEMKTRVLERLGKIGLDRLIASVTEESRISTFHSLCLRLLRPHLVRLGYSATANVVPSSVAQEARVRHTLKVLSTHADREKLLSLLSLKNLTAEATRYWFRANGKSLGIDIDSALTFYEQFRRGTLSQVQGLLAQGGELKDTERTWLECFAASLLAPETAPLDGLHFRGNKKLFDAYPDVREAAENWKTLVQEGLPASLSLQAVQEEDEAQRVLASFFAELRTTGPHLLDFSAMEFELHRLLKCSTERLFPAPELLLVDEFQDTNRTQYEILQGISGERTEWYFVGDPKQSIYRFRGADASLFRKLTQELTREELAHNYRSLPAALDFMNKLQAGLFAASRPLDPAPQSLHSARAKKMRDELLRDLPRPALPAVELSESRSESLLREQLVRDFHRRSAELGPQATHAVLFKRWRSLYRFAGELLRQGVPFRISGTETYLDHHLTDIFALTLEWIDNPNLALGAMAYARWKNPEQWQPQLPNSPELERLRQELGPDARAAGWSVLLHRFVAQLRPSRWFRGAEWTSAMERLILDLEAMGLPQTMTLTEFSQFLRRHSAALEREVPGHIQSTPHGALLDLYTVHASKGLQFDAIYLPELSERGRGGGDTSLESDEGVAFRLKLRGTQANQVSERPSLIYLRQKRQEQLELEAESRRLFYVAVTRAQSTLNLYFKRPSEKTATKRDPLSAILQWPTLTPSPWNKILVELYDGGHWQSLESGGHLSWNTLESEETTTDSDAPAPTETWSWPAAHPPLPQRTPFFREGVSRYIARQFKAPFLGGAARKAATDPAQLSTADLGTEIHRVLERWSGDTATLEALLPNIPERPAIESAVRAIRALPALTELWAAIARGDPGVRRELGLYVHSSRYRLSGYADLAWFRGEELVLLDWKTGSRLSALKRSERTDKIRLQLQLYAEAFASRFKTIRAVAVGLEVARDSERTPRAEIILDEVIRAKADT